MMEERWSEGPPDIYAWQIRAQAATMNTTASSIACALGGNRLLWADDELSALHSKRLVRVAEEFWWHVEQDVPPPADRKDDLKALNATYTPDGSRIALGRSFSELDMEYVDLLAELKEAIVTLLFRIEFDQKVHVAIRSGLAADEGAEQRQATYAQGPNSILGILKSSNHFTTS